MTTVENSPYPARVVVRRGSAAAAAVASYLGGYILVQSLVSPLATALSGYGAGPDVAVLLGAQVLFALVVIIVGFVLAPASVTRKFIASLIVVIGVVVTLAVEVVRLTSGFGGMAGGMTLANPFFMVALTVGAGWLIVRYARLGWLALLLTAVLVPLPYAFAFAGATSVVSQMVLLVVLGIVGAVILLVGRPWRQVAVAPAYYAAPVVAPADVAPTDVAPVSEVAPDTEA